MFAGTGSPKIQEILSQQLILLAREGDLVLLLKVVCKLTNRNVEAAVWASQLWIFNVEDVHFSNVTWTLANAPQTLPVLGSQACICCVEWTRELLCS